MGVMGLMGSMGSIQEDCQCPCKFIIPMSPMIPMRFTVIHGLHSGSLKRTAGTVQNGVHVATFQQQFAEALSVF